MNGRSLGEIGARYDQRRAEILALVAAGKVSGSMSGIEYYAKPWSELNMWDDGDVFIIATFLTWDGQRHTHTGLQRKAGPGMRDLQTEWEPVSFVWTRCKAPEPTDPRLGLCFCMGMTRPEHEAAGLCRCKYEARYGVLDRRPTLPPVRGAISGLAHTLEDAT